MSVNSINLLVDILSNEYVKIFLSTGFNVFSNDDKSLSIEANNAFEHKGLYAFMLTKNGNTGMVYVGKSEGDDRLRQHLTGENKDGSILAITVRTKNNEIKEAIKDGYNVKLSLLSDEEFKKSSLGCLEVECILKGQKQLKGIWLDVNSWNQRVG